MLFFSRGRHFFNNPDMTHFLSLFWEGNDLVIGRKQQPTIRKGRVFGRR